MLRIGTVGFDWMSMRYWSVERRMSLARFSLPGSLRLRGTSAVIGAEASMRAGSMRARRAMYSRTGALAMTLPSSAARVVSEVKA